MDALNLTLSLDTVTANAYDKLAPHNSIFNLDAVRQVSRNPAHPKPAVTNYANWLHDTQPEIPDPIRMAAMALLPDA